MSSIFFNQIPITELLNQKETKQKLLKYNERIKIEYL